MPKPRRPSRLKPLKTLKIFCEGEKTEPGYLNGYIATLQNDSRKTVIEVQKTKKNTAVQLVEEAIKAKKSPEAMEDDEFWVVCDREAKTKYSDGLHAKAFDMAEKAGIEIALCNVCFEYWLLLHFIETDAPFYSFEDLVKRSSLNNEIVKLHGKDYDKSSPAIFNIVKDRITEARARGFRLNSRGKSSAAQGRDKPYHINPYVGVVELLDAIDAFTALVIAEDGLVVPCAAQ